MQEQYDVVVIGGGTAGLSGALALSRARRSVLVVDAGAQRNAPAAHVHNYLGREGATPAELLATGRAEVAGYGGEVVPGTVVAATREESADVAFRVQLADGTTVRARRLLVATGLVDELPEVPGLRERWGRDVLHCPYCHGWEVRDTAIGVLGSSPMGVHQALLLRQWSADLTYFVHTAPAPTAEELEQLQARGITVVAGAVAGLEVADDTLAGVRMATGDVVAVQALAVAPRFVARADALAGLGLAAGPLEMGGHVLGTQVVADPGGATTVPGVWVAGNVADVRAGTINAAAAGLFVATGVNADLVAEDTRRAVAEHRATLDFFGEPAWEQRYRDRDAIWSGNPNPQLVAEAADLTPGAALDVGSGEGADSLWLAARGWRVTGVDFSTVALERSATHAADAGLSVTWTHADLTAWTPPARSFDLVTAQFMHLPTPVRQALYARLAEAVTPGGTLLLVGHEPSADHPARAGMMFTAPELAGGLDPVDWEVQVAESRPRVYPSPGGHVADVVLRARRR